MELRSVVGLLPVCLLWGASGCVEDDGCHEADLILVTTEAEAAAIADLSCVTGSLFAGAAITTLDLPALESVRGEIRIGGSEDLTSVSMPALTTVGQAFVVQQTTNLQTLDLPLLTSVGAAYYTFNDALEHLDGMTAIVSIEGELVVEWNASLLDFDGLALLESVGGKLTVNNNPPVTLDWGALRSVGGNLRLLSSDALRDFRTPLLESIDGSLIVTSKIDLEVLVLPALTRIEADLTVTENWSLPTCSVQALLDTVTARKGVGGQVTISGNDDAAPCN